MKGVGRWVLVVAAVVFIAAAGSSSWAGAPVSGMRSMRFQPGGREQAAAWQRAVRTRLLAAMKMDDLVARRAKLRLDATKPVVWDMGSYTLKSLSIRATPRRMIHIVTTAPKRVSGRLPAVVCIGGHGSNVFTTYRNGRRFGPIAPDDSDLSSVYKGFAAELAKRGYVTVATVVSEHEVHESGRTLLGQRLWDLMRCVDYLQSLPYVDATRIGCAGLSLGGEMAMWLGAMDTRIAAVVSAGWLTMFDQMEHEHCMCWKFPGLRELVDVPDIFGLIAPRPVLCQNGEQEPQSQFPPSVARRAAAEIAPIYAVFGAADNFRLHIHGGGHEVDLPALGRFFDTRLGRWQRAAK